MRFHPGAGTKESIAKPDGTVSSTDVVVRFAFSVGTSRPNSWRCFESTTVGLISACAQATLVKTSAATVARAPVTRRRFMCIVPSGRAAASPPPRSGRERGRRPAGEVETWESRAKGRLGAGERPEGRPKPRARSCPQRLEGSPHPAQEVARGGLGRGGEERERAEDRQRVAVDRPDQAVQPVEAEARPPVQVRLERREGERGGDEEPERSAEDMKRAERRRLAGASRQEVALADGYGRDPEHGRRGGGRARQCHDSGYDESRPAGLALELVPVDRRMLRARVCERARGEDDEPGDRKPGQPAAHRTRSVKGAVRIFPFAWNWRKSRQVPGSGTSTTTFRRPGLDERPTARAPPRIDVQPVAAGLHTCGWK